MTSESQLNQFETLHPSGNTAERSYFAANVPNEAIWDWNLVTGTVVWDERVQTLFGYSAQQIGGDATWWYHNVHSEDRGRVIASIHSVINGGGTSWRNEYRFRRSNGDYAHIFDRGYVVRDDAGKALRMIGTMEDLTGRIKAEQALRESEERFRRLAEAMPQLVWTADDSGAVTYQNSLAKRYESVFKDADAKWRWQPVIHSDDRPATVAAWKLAVSSGERYQCEHRVRMADGSFRWHLSRADRVQKRWPSLLGQVSGFLKWSPCRWLRLSTVPPPAPLRRKASGAVDNQIRITPPVRSVGF